MSGSRRWGRCWSLCWGSCPSPRVHLAAPPPLESQVSQWPGAQRICAPVGRGCWQPGWGRSQGGSEAQVAAADARTHSHPLSSAPREGEFALFGSRSPLSCPLSMGSVLPGGTTGQWARAVLLASFSLIQTLDFPWSTSLSATLNPCSVVGLTPSRRVCGRGQNMTQDWPVRVVHLPGDSNWFRSLWAKRTQF